MPYQRTRQRQNRPKRARKKRRMNHKRFNYDVDDPPCMSFQGVSEFLGDSPLPRKTALKWNSFQKIFDLLWERDDPDIKRGSGWGQRYRQGYHKALEMLYECDSDGSPESLSGRLREKVRTSFEYYCPCFPATCIDKWIAPSGRSATWLAFRRDGSQDGDATSLDECLEQDNSWTWIRRSIKWDRMFNRPVRDIVVVEEIEQLIRQRRMLRFRSYDGTLRELPYYQDDRDAHNSATELRSARENRRRQLERRNPGGPKPHAILQRLMSAKGSEEKRRITEESRRIETRASHIVLLDRERKERAKGAYEKESHRTVKSVE
jgi:hypothetical protein